MGTTQWSIQVKFWMGRYWIWAPDLESVMVIWRLARMLRSGNHLISPLGVQPSGIRKLMASMLLMPGSLIAKRENFRAPSGVGLSSDFFSGLAAGFFARGLSPPL